MTSSTYEGTAVSSVVIENISQKQGSTDKPVPLYVDAETITVTLADFHVAQVGSSVRFTDESLKSSAHGGNRKQKLAACNGDGKLKENSQPDQAGNAPELASAMFSPAASTDRFDVSKRSTRDDIAVNDRMEGVLDVERTMPLIRKQGSLKGFKWETIVKRLETLQDNGQFKEHETLACGLLDSTLAKEDRDISAALMIERGVAFYYADDLRCKRIFTAVMRMGSGLVNRELLEGRALFLKATVYRQEKKFNKALQSLQRAEILLSNHKSDEDKAELYHAYGTLWLDMYSNRTSNQQGRKIFKEEAQKCFERAIEYGGQDKKTRVQLKKKRYSNLKMAVLHLDCGSKASWITQHVLDKDVNEAKKHLDLVEYQLSDGMPLGTKVQLLTIRSDQHYREGNLRLAIEVAKKAIETAEKLEKNSAIPMLKKRIEALQTMEDMRSPVYAPVITTTTDSGWSGDCSGSD